MAFFSGIKNSRVSKHLLLALLVTAILVFLIGRLLKWYTHHGQEFVVPNLVGMTLPEMERSDSMADFSPLVLDSIYDTEKKKGSIAFQDPPPGSVAKRGRIIYLTLVANLPEKVSMPNLIDLTLRQATAVLETYGLKAGTLEYQPDIARNAVLKQRHRHHDIEPGTWVEKGASIDLVIGKGGSSMGANVPFLLGKRRGEAISAIREAFFIPGREVYEDGKDTLHARVYRQSPSYLSQEYHKTGQAIDLWYRSDLKFDFEAFIEQYRRDSLGSDSDSL